MMRCALFAIDGFPQTQIEGGESSGILRERVDGGSINSIDAYVFDDGREKSGSDPKQTLKLRLHRSMQ